MKSPEVIERLRELQDDRGVITPDVVLSDAEDPSSPLHGYFEWDDSVAAVEYRRMQARHLIRSVRVVIRQKRHNISTIAYVRDPDATPKEQGYRYTPSLRSEKQRARAALIRELGMAESALKRAYEVADALGLSGEVDSLLAQLRNVSEAA